MIRVSLRQNTCGVSSDFKQMQEDWIQEIRLPAQGLSLCGGTKALHTFESFLSVVIIHNNCIPYESMIALKHEVSNRLKIRTAYSRTNPPFSLLHLDVFWIILAVPQSGIP